MIKALLSPEEFLARGCHFGVPSQAEFLPGSVNLYTLPGATGLLFKRISSIEELNAVGSGVAYISATGASFAAYIGAVARVPLELGDATAWPAGAYTTSDSAGSHVYDKPVTTEPVIPLWSVKGALIKRANAAGIDGDSLISETVKFALSSQACDTIPTFLCPGSSTALLKHPIVAAVCSGADAGFIVQTSIDYAAGWQSTQISLGKMELGVRTAMDKILETATSDIRPYLVKAYNQMAGARVFEQLAYMNITTNYAPSIKENGTRIGVGMAIPQPALLTKSASSACLSDFTIPTLERPQRIPAAIVYSPQGVPSSTLSGIAAWHRMGEAGRSGAFYPIPAGTPSGGGWNDVVACIRDLTADDAGLSGQTLTGIDPGGAPPPSSNYGPSAGRNINRALQFWGQTQINPWLTGRIIRQYFDATRAIYSRAEGLMRQG